MIMSGVGTTYGMGAATGKRSGSHSATGMLYFTSCGERAASISTRHIACYPLISAKRPETLARNKLLTSIWR